MEETKKTIFALFLVIVLGTVLLYSSFPARKTEGGGELPVTLVSSFDTIGSADAESIAVSGNYAYIGTDNNNNTNPEFYILNISSPQNPTLTGSLNINMTTNRLAVAGNYVYLATNLDTEELAVIDVTNKSAPTIAGGYNLSGGLNALAVYATSTTLYVGTNGNSEKEFYVFDTSNKASWKLRGSYEIGGSVKDIFVNGTHAYLATSLSNKEFLELNVANPTNIFEEASYNAPGTGGANAIDYAYGRAYLTTQNNGISSDFFVLDVASTSPVTLLGSVDLGTNGSDVKVFGNYAYVATRGTTGAGLSVVNITNPVAPQRYSSFNAAANGNGISLGPKYVYLATAHNTQELQILNVGFDISQIVHDVNGDDIITVACMGDSNTSYGWWPGPTWCEQLASNLGADSVTIGSPDRGSSGLFKVINNGWGGSAALDFYGKPTAWGEFYAGRQLTGVLALEHPDAIIMAYGTNDLRYASAWKKIPQDQIIPEIVKAYQSYTASTTALNIPLFVALTPPMFPPADHISGEIFDLNGAVITLNTAIKNAFPIEKIVDFNSNMLVPDYQSDGLHLNVLGHQKRMRAVYKKLLGTP